MKPQVNWTYEIKTLPRLPGKRVSAQLWLHAEIQGHQVSSTCIASGPQGDIEDFLAGTLTWNELEQAILGQS